METFQDDTNGVWGGLMTEEATEKGGDWPIGDHFDQGHPGRVVDALIFKSWLGTGRYDPPGHVADPAEGAIHDGRMEHVAVTEGLFKCTTGDRTHLLSFGQSITLPPVVKRVWQNADDPVLVRGITVCWYDAPDSTSYPTGCGPNHDLAIIEGKAGESPSKSRLASALRPGSDCEYKHTLILAFRGSLALAFNRKAYGLDKRGRLYFPVTKSPPEVTWIDQDKPFRLVVVSY